MKKIFSIIIAILSLCMLATTSISASDVAENTDTIEFFEFTESDARMESDGNFTFLVRIRLVSDTFYATTNLLRINTEAWIYDQAQDLGVENADPDDIRFEDPNITYTVTLYKKSNSEEVAHYTGRCNRDTSAGLFSVEMGERYYIVITSNYDFTASPRYIEGEGRVYPISFNEP